MTLDASGALALVEAEGVVLVAARGPVPRLTEAIIGEEIVGSWWGHPRGHEIYAVLESVTESPDVLVCRAVAGKVTVVHRRLWPALVRAGEHLGADRCARVEQEHTERGHHVVHETPFPSWAPEEVRAEAGSLSLEAAIDALGEWSRSPRRASPHRARPR